MFNHRHYVPILKWKMGEYQALQRLTAYTKDSLTPLLEIPPVGFDFETGQHKETADDHLGDFGRRLKSKWQGRPCFVDLKYLPSHTRMAGGRHYVDAVFNAARTEGCAAIPVVSFANDADFMAAGASVVGLDHRGVCLRLTMDDFDRPALASDIEMMLRSLGLGWSDADLVIDLGAPNYVPLAIYVRTMAGLFDLVPALNRWRTLTIAGTAFPPSPVIAAINSGTHKLFPRHEWAAYRAFIGTLGREIRIPTFGDYAAATPDLVELNPRIIKPLAKLRYTIDNGWHVGRGAPVRTEGFGQYQEMCSALVRQSYFSGAAFSAGDEYVARCAAGTVPTGNLSTWVWVSTNRHLTKVAADLASLHGLSVAAE